MSGASAWLSVYPGHADRGSETDVHSTEYLLEFGSAALDPVTLRPPLVVAGYHYCAAPADCVVRAGTSLTVALPVSTGLQSFGVTDLTGFAVALLLLLAGAGGVAVARTRRRGVEAGTGGV